MDFDWDAILGAVEKATPVVVKAVNTLKKKPKSSQVAVASALQSQGVNVPTRASSAIPMPWILAGGAGLLLAFFVLRRA